MKILKKTLSSLLAVAVAVAGLVIVGCGVDKQESVSVNLETFTSPTGNIGCIADETMVRCDIRKSSWKLKPNPDCQLDWGNGLSVADGPGEIVCAGDTTMNSGPEVAYGTINMVGPFECMTNETGNSMRCENMNTGHGFEMDPATYKTF